MSPHENFSTVDVDNHCIIFYLFYINSWHRGCTMVKNLVSFSAVLSLQYIFALVSSKCASVAIQKSNRFSFSLLLHSWNSLHKIESWKKLLNSLLANFRFLVWISCILELAFVCHAIETLWSKTVDKTCVRERYKQLVVWMTLCDLSI